MALPQGLALPPVPERLLSSPIDAYSGTSGICPKIDSVDGYCCDHGGGHTGHLSTPDLASQYHFLAPGQPLAPSGEPPGLPEGLLMWVFPRPRPRIGLFGSPSCIFLGCSGVDLPMLIVP